VKFTVTTAPEETLEPKVTVTWFSPGFVETLETVAAVPPAVTATLLVEMELGTAVS
jgi:hypothetical protein